LSTFGGKRLLNIFTILGQFRRLDADALGTIARPGLHDVVQNLVVDHMQIDVLTSCRNSSVRHRMHSAHLLSVELSLSHRGFLNRKRKSALNEQSSPEPNPSELKSTHTRIPTFAPSFRFDRT